MKINNKYLVETIVFLSYTLFAMAWVGGTASMAEIMRAMEINTLASASFISGAVTLAKIFGTFLAAWLAIKVGVKYAFFLSGILIAIGLLTPFSPNYELLLISRFLMGLGGALMIVYFNPIVMSWFPVNERSTINGLNAVAFNVGTGIVLWQMGNFNQFLGGWKCSLLLFSVVSIALSLLWLLVDNRKFLPQNQDDSQNSNNENYLSALKDKFNWYYPLTYCGILSLYICLFTFYPKAGISQTTYVIGAGILGTLAGIIFSKKVLERLPVIRWSGLIITLSVVGLSFGESTTLQTVSAVILGFFVFFPITALVSIPHELKGMSSQRITIIFSLFYSISYLISTFVLWWFGKLVDLNQGDYSQSFILICLVSSTFFIGSFFLPETAQTKESS